MKMKQMKKHVTFPTNMPANIYNYVNLLLYLSNGSKKKKEEDFFTL